MNEPPEAAPASKHLRRLVWPLAIGLLGLVLRLAYALPFAEHPVGRLPWGDEGAYWSRALEIRQGRWLPARPFYQDPLLPYVLAGLTKLVGPDVPRLRMALAALGALTPLLIYRAGRRGLGQAEAIVAGLAAATYGPLLFTDGLLEKEGPGALVAALGLALAAELAARPRLPLAIVTGFAWGALALLRANALVVAPIGAAWAAALGNGNAVGSIRLERRAALAIGFLAAFALALAPATIVNALVGRPPELLLTTWQAGANFYIGNGPEATGTYAAPAFVEPNASREAHDFAAEAERRTGRFLTPGQVSRFWRDEALKHWRADPRASLAHLARKLGLLVHDTEIPDNHDLGFARTVSPALGWGLLSFGIVLPFAAAGLARFPRGLFWWFTVLTTLAGLGATALFFVVGRYRIPWVPGLLLLAASGAVDLVRRVRQRRWQSVAGRLVLLIAPALALAWRPMPDPAPDRWGHGLINLALADLGAGRLDYAIDALDDARALGPGPAERIDELLSGGMVRDRLAALAQRVKDSQNAPPDTIRRARRLRQFPDRRSIGRDLLQQALRRAPDDSEALREWGAWWLGLPGDLEARLRAADALARAARDPSAAILLALLTKDARRLPPESPTSDPVRLRLARAILRLSKAPR